MSKVTFRSKQAFLQVPHELIFHVGVVHAPYDEKGKWIGSTEEWEKLQSLPDPDMVNNSYTFLEGVGNNELTLEREDAIEGMRAYIASRNDYLIVELDEEGNEPADPEGTVFECKTTLYQLYPAIYKGVSTAEGKTFSFNRGEKQNRYITNDAEEIKILRDYIKTRVDNEFTEVRE